MDSPITPLQLREVAAFLERQTLPDRRGSIPLTGSARNTHGSAARRFECSMAGLRNEIGISKFD